MLERVFQASSIVSHMDFFSTLFPKRKLEYFFTVSHNFPDYSDKV